MLHTIINHLLLFIGIFSTFFLIFLRFIIYLLIVYHLHLFKLILHFCSNLSMLAFCSFSFFFFEPLFHLLFLFPAIMKHLLCIFPAYILKFTHFLLQFHLSFCVFSLQIYSFPIKCSVSTK